MPRLKLLPMSPRLKLALGFAAAAVIGLAVGVGSYLLLTGDEVKPRPKDGRYSNSRVRYQFEYPIEWKDLSAEVKGALPAGADTVDYLAVGDTEAETGILNGIQIIVVRIDHTVSGENLEKELVELEPLFRQQATRAAGILKDPQWVELGGLKARQYITQFELGRANQPLVSVVSTQVVTFFGDRQYTVNCQGRLATFDEKVLPGCELVLQTFRFR